MSLNAPTGPASARVYRDPGTEIQLQILNRLDRIIELLTPPVVVVDPPTGWTREQTLDAHAWQTARDVFDPTSTRADDTHG